ncbi:MAG: acyltransferase [Saprospiraceae bacterium]|nr:MAG: acyltransferase [Saprospiraceae bacterium]
MLSRISQFILRLVGWKVIIHTNPIPPKFVMIAAPHTSNWDFPLGLLSRSVMRMDIKYVGKESLFRPPFGTLFRWLGGIPVDRSKRTNFVEAVIDMFNDREEFKICIAPEGTRKKVSKFKTGFYHIAKGAGIPILLCKLDYEHRVLSLSEPFYTTDNMEADFEFIYNYFRGTKGKKPQNSFN